MSRTFQASPAVRKHVPLLLGLAGPSGGGKTFSALRLATGIQRVAQAGPIYVIDTESSRALHYAEQFSFRHVPFGAPFGPLDYVAAIEFAVNDGAGVVIVDSTSHEWEGPGGVLECADAEEARMAKAQNKPRHKVGVGKWAKPKRDHRRMINTLLQLPCHFIFCFRAKKKLKDVRGKAPVEMGWQPITSGDLIYEFAASILLPPGADGVPDWTPSMPGEKEMIKRPGWAADILRDGRQLDEHVGEELARWAAGDALRTLDEVLADLGAAAQPSQVGALRSEAKALWGALNEREREALTKAMKVAAKRVSDAEAPETESEPAEEAPGDGELSAEEEDRMARELGGQS